MSTLSMNLTFKRIYLRLCAEKRRKKSGCEWLSLTFRLQFSNDEF